MANSCVIIFFIILAWLKSWVYMKVIDNYSRPHQNCGPRRLDILEMLPFKIWVRTTPSFVLYVAYCTRCLTPLRTVAQVAQVANSWYCRLLVKGKIFSNLVIFLSGSTWGCLVWILIIQIDRVSTPGPAFQVGAILWTWFVDMEVPASWY